jgi:precorrin-2 dehydrogenase / sirohydrochlorin ferrochelatase
MGFIPIFLQVEGKPCLVIGGGPVARRKVEALVAAGAAITVISPEVDAALAGMAESGRIALLRRPYRQGDMAGHHLVYAATNDRQLQRDLFEEACRLNILINVADAPELCSFIVPSVLRRGRLHVAISTEGASPATARVLRERMNQWLGDELEVLLEVMAAARDWLKTHERDPATRARKLNALAASDLDNALRRGDWRAAERLLARCLDSDVNLADLGLDSGSLAGCGKTGSEAGANGIRK